MVPARNLKGKYIMGLTVKQMKYEVVAKVAQIKQLRQELKTLRVDIKRERSINRVVMEDHRRLVREKREAKREAKKAAQIAKLEAKLLAIKSPKARRQANQKASDVKVYSAAEIAALNEARA